MKELNFIGCLPASKSLFNRLLIVQSFFPELILEGDSDCEDVKMMQQALAHLGGEDRYDCGHAGTVLRFLSFRLSREPGEHLLIGSERLFARPQDELIVALRQLGCQVELGKNQLKILSTGWQLMGDSLHVSAKRSSQFISGILLSSWKYDKPIHISPGRTIISPDYWQMTVSLMKKLGLQVEKWESDYVVKPTQNLTLKKIKVEQDLSSAFAIAAIAAVRGKAIFQEFPTSSLQPDSIFPRVLSEMGVATSFENNTLKIEANDLRAIDFDINLAPDMFPVLAVLTAQAKGKSRFIHGEQLRFKESDRLKNILSLIQKMNKRFELRENMLEIIGTPEVHKNKITFDCLQDHRLAMAAGLAKYMGYDIEILNPHVVTKSFPDYWDIIGTAL